MAAARDSLIDLERHRLLLEDNVNQLRTALQHWQTWDAEYEGLKEEVEAAQNSDSVHLDLIRRDFKGDLVTDKEIGDIFGPGNNRTSHQIISLLDRRIDYVTKNIESLRKQLEAAENKYAAASVISQPDMEDEEGQPMTEIIEELDEDDNVVSYRLNQPGQSMSHIQEALEKVGINDINEVEKERESQKMDKIPSAVEKHPEVSNEQSRSQPLPQPEFSSLTTPSITDDNFSIEAKPLVSDKPKKTMSLVEDDEVVHDEFEGPRPAVRRVQNIMETAKDQQKILNQPVIPENEDSEDAALRKEMLKYSMGEVGAVVAELQLEEGYTDEEDYEFDYTDDEEEGEEEDDDDDDDKYGRYTGRVITDDYMQRMLELEEKLGVKSRFTMKEEARAAAAAAAAGEDSDADDTRIGLIKVNANDKPTSSATKPEPPKSIIKEKQSEGSEKKKKGVSFAKSLDIAPDQEPANVTASSVKHMDTEPLVEPLSDIVERTPATRQKNMASAARPSRFKQSKNDNGSVPKGPMDVASSSSSFFEYERPAAPTGPEGKTLSDSLVERETVSRPMPADDEFDDLMIHSEVADRHQQLRRKFIGREGGFLQENESAIMPLDDHEQGLEKPSRFKAARLSRQ